MTTLRNKDLARLMKAHCSGIYNLAEFEDFLDIFTEVVKLQVLEGNTILIKELGSFNPKLSKDKTLISGLTGKSSFIPAGMTMGFKVSGAVQKYIKEEYLARNPKTTPTTE